MLHQGIGFRNWNCFGGGLQLPARFRILFVSFMLALPTASPSLPYLACHSPNFSSTSNNLGKRIWLAGMNSWQQTTLRSLFLPTGVLFLLAVLLLQGGIVTLSASAVDFFYYSIFLAAIFLAWRFHSGRILSTLVLLLVSHHALEFFSAGKVVAGGPGRIAFEAIAFLLPLNLIALALDRDWRPSVAASIPRLVVLFFQAVFVALLCRPGASSPPAILHADVFSKLLFRWTQIPQPALLLVLMAVVVLIVRFLVDHKPFEAGLLWSLAAVVAGMNAGGVGRIGSAYFATADPCQARGNHAENLVAGVMPISVVEALKVVDVGHSNGIGSRKPGQSLVEGAARGQAGKLIVITHEVGRLDYARARNHGGSRKVSCSEARIRRAHRQKTGT